MSRTIIGPTGASIPSKCVAPIVQIRRKWSDPWRVRPDLMFLGGNWPASGHDLAQAVFRYRYGYTKNQWESDYGAKRPSSIVGCWVRVLFFGSGGFLENWIGQISGEGRDVYGPIQTPFGTIPAGIQHFEAYGPQQVLRKIHVSRSYWEIPLTDDPVEIGWIPGLNERYGLADQPFRPNQRSGPALGDCDVLSQSGNMGGAKTLENGSEVHVYGGKNLWNYRQYLDYLVGLFINTDSDGPQWSLGGQLDVLEKFKDPIQFEVTQTIDEILSRLIDPRYGVDYKIVSTPEGFQIFVFMLTKDPIGFGAETLPGNPDLVKIVAARVPDCLSTRVSRTSAHRYRKIRILGNRIVVCTSLYANKDHPMALGVASLGCAWNPRDEMAYLSGSGHGEDSPAVHDLARKQEKYKDVYRKFAASVGWYQSTTVPHAPLFDGFGSPSQSNAPMQRCIRSTLSWLPLQAQVDYSVWPPREETGLDWIDTEAYEPHQGLLQPKVWLYDDVQQTWTPADKTGIGFSVLHDLIGVRLHHTRNHLLAKNTMHLNGNPSQYQPEWDWKKMAITVAYETDQRICLEQTFEPAKKEINTEASLIDGVLEIDASDCHFWLLLLGTILDVDEQGQLVYAAGPPGFGGQWVRNDWARLTAKMAGAMARHYRDRMRAEVVIAGFAPWRDLLGQILTVIDEGGDCQQINSPITEIRWESGDGHSQPKTTISAGFATGEQG